LFCLYLSRILGTAKLLVSHQRFRTPTRRGTEEWEAHTYPGGVFEEEVFEELYEKVKRRRKGWRS
jgi:hypothetical protein